ncbi:hypothetical protein [Sphingomonas sp.]|jgi:hypothetical protein|uniref:hypothetical protein n=1 Tax=Sphingomonas sp. TaxID=28214 RepID=UPI002D80B402|nr:hypothetical protein [Sphingomonas sp.]HEU0045245.1 hypothetical protein [Sphingomonas sp.]
MRSLAALLLLTAATPEEQVLAVADALAAAEAATTRKSLLDATDRLEKLGARGELPGDRRAAAGRRASVPWRGRASGPAFRHGELPGGGEMATEQIFLAGESAVVAVVPGGNRALSVRITGPDGSAVCEQRVAPPRAACRWVPVFTRRFRITVANPAGDPARYYLVSN